MSDRKKSIIYLLCFALILIAIGMVVSPYVCIIAVSSIFGVIAVLCLLLVFGVLLEVAVKGSDLGLEPVPYMFAIIFGLLLVSVGGFYMVGIIP